MQVVASIEDIFAQPSDVSMTSHGHVANIEGAPTHDSRPKSRKVPYFIIINLWVPKYYVKIKLQDELLLGAA